MKCCSLKILFLLLLSTNIYLFRLIRLHKQNSAMNKNPTSWVIDKWYSLKLMLINLSMLSPSITIYYPKYLITLMDYSFHHHRGQNGFDGDTTQTDIKTVRINVFFLWERLNRTEPCLNRNRMHQFIKTK